MKVDYQPKTQGTTAYPSADRTAAEWRAFYEEAGQEAIESGQGLECSTAPISDVVRRMAVDPRWSYTSVLDVGCGANMSYAAFLDDLGKHVVGVDFTYHFLSIAKHEGRVRIVQGDATLLPFPSASFDAVVCSETLEHIPDDVAAIAEIRRVLAPGGLLFVTVPNYWNAARVLAAMRRAPGYRDMMTGHLREYSPAQVDRLLESGFSVRARYRVPFHWRGIVGGPIDFLIRRGVLSRLSMSVALVATRTAD